MGNQSRHWPLLGWGMLAPTTRPRTVTHWPRRARSRVPCDSSAASKVRL